MTSRRDFISTGAGAAALAFATGHGEENPGLIDAHVHVWTPDTEKYPLAPGFTRDRMKPPSFTPEELFAHCRPQGVARIVLIQMSFYGFDNSYMLDAMKQHPGVFGGVAVIDENGPSVRKTMLELAEKGVRGFRIRSTAEKARKWPVSPGMKEMWETGAEGDLSMCLLADPDSLPGALEMCRLFPKTPVVIDHFARIGMNGTVEPDDLEWLLEFAKYEKVTVKTSAFYALGKKEAPYTDLGPMIEKLRDTFGAERLMWATDCPYQVINGHTYEDSVALIRDRLDFLTDSDKEWMLRKTAEKVFF